MDKPVVPLNPGLMDITVTSYGFLLKSTGTGILANKSRYRDRGGAQP
jgi:hypothetical protein